MVRGLWERFRSWIVVALAGTATAGAGMMALSSGGSLDVYVGSTPTPTATATGTPTPGPTSANLFVDTTGGTCTRQGTAGAYVDAQACSSIQTACAAASNGDQVIVKNGTYGNQDITCRTSGTAPAVVVTGESQAGVLILAAGVALGVTGSKYLTLQNMTARATSGGNQLTDIAATSNVVYDGMVIDADFFEIDAFKLSGGNDAYTFKNGEIKDVSSNAGSGGGGSAQLVEILNFASRGANTNITFQDCSVHGHKRNASGTHTESWLIWTTPLTQNLTIDRCKLYDNSAFLMNVSGGIQGNWIIRNSVLEHPQELDGTNPNDPAGEGAQLIDGCDPSTDHAGWVWEYNILDGPWVGCNGVNGMTLRGNVGIIGNCTGDPGTTFLYNVWTDADCSASDVQDSSALSKARFVDWDGNDFRSSGTALCGKGDPSSFPSVDLAGASRSAADAGPYKC